MPAPDDADRDEETAVEINPTEARQGGIGRQVLIVLVASLVLGLVFLGGVTLYRVATDTAGREPALVDQTDGASQTPPDEPPTPTTVD